MKLTRLIFPCCTVAALVACGGSQSTETFRANAPTFDKLAVAQNDSDVAQPSMDAPADVATQAVIAPDCHPHLFQRTGEIIHRVNKHFFKLVRHVEEMISDNPKLSSGTTKTWEKVKEGVDRKFTMTSVANLDGSITYNFELDVKSTTGTADFVKVMSGSLTHTGPAEAEVAAAAAATRVEDKGSVTFDYTALSTVVPTEKSRGQITDTFDNIHDPVKGVKRSATLALTAFVPEEGDVHGPRTGSYSWEREPGVGGKFQFDTSVVLLCPTNTLGKAADVTTVARWYHTTDGVHGRSDSKATGGQILAGNSWLAVTCAKGQTTSAPAEGYWMMKLEDAGGATVAGSAVQDGSTASTPCDAAFGPVPSLTSSASDYNFSAAVTFPGEW